MDAGLAAIQGSKLIMSDVFTTIQADHHDWVTNEILNELFLAWHERKKALGQGSTLFVVEDGQDVSEPAFFSQMQSWVNSNLSNFVNHTLGSFNNELEITMFTQAAFRTEAGLHSSGFRRAREWSPDDHDDWTDNDDDMFMYGVQTERDIIGPWDVVDLQLAFTAMQHTVAAIDYTGAGPNSSWSWRTPLIQTDYQSGETCNDLLTTIWDWVNQRNPYSYQGGYHVEFNLVHGEFWVGPGEDDYVDVWAALGHHSCTPAEDCDVAVWTGRPCAMDFYWRISGDPSMGGFAVTAGNYYLSESTGEASTTPRNPTTDLADIDDDPYPPSGVACPEGGNQTRMIGLSAADAVVKWNFTNSN